MHTHYDVKGHHRWYMHTCKGRSQVVVWCVKKYTLFVLVFPDIGESTKLVSEYKAKLQISEAENAKLEGTVSGISTYVLCA